MTAVSLDRDPPAWATALHRHRDGLRDLTRMLIDADSDPFLHFDVDAALANIYRAIPDEERVGLLKAVRDASWFDPDSADDDHEPGTGPAPFAAALDALVFAYETHVAAAYQHGPHLGRWQDATRVPTVEEQADALLADLAAIPVTVGTVAEVAAKIGGAA